MLRLECCADTGACDCFECRPIPLTSAHVAEVYARAGAPLDDDELDELERMTPDQLAEQLVYLADFQG